MGRHHILGDIGEMSLGLERTVLHLEEPLDLRAARGGLDKAEKELNRGGLAHAVCTGKQKTSPASIEEGSRPSMLRNHHNV